MQADPSAASLVSALALATVLAGCAVTRPAPAPAASLPAVAQPEPAPQLPPPPAEAVAPVPTERPAVYPADTVLAYADRTRGLPAPDLALEILRLGDAAYAPEPAMQLALALGYSRNAANVQRALALLQRVQQDPEARPLHALARMVSAQLAEQRRLEELAERNAQQVRESQRRIEQLNERLEAVRAIERSLPTRPRSEAPPPRAATPRISAR